MRISRILLVLAIFLNSVFLCFSMIARAEDSPKLSEKNGPFMVLAYSFRGPDAEAQAITLAAELRQDHELPAFRYEAPGKNGPSFQVLVGNCKSMKEAFELTNRVKKLKTKSLVAYQRNDRGKGLSRAIATRNPLIENQ